MEAMSVVEIDNTSPHMAAALRLVVVAEEIVDDVLGREFAFHTAVVNMVVNQLRNNATRAAIHASLRRVNPNADNNMENE
ncbi:MAG TPA: hypothetical protein PKV72_02395 [Candidatus Peribacteria bacterium]|nr:hypothetical protein [Candidatus Peribacteria bacterium]